MNPDPFASPFISQVLTWLFSIPVVCGILAWGVSMLFEKQEGLPRLFTIWLLICLLIFSPLRYTLLQLLMATAFPFQSVAALLSTFLLAIYIPIVFAILLAIGIGAPLFLVALIAGMKEPFSTRRLILAGITCPVILWVFSTIFYNVLPFAAYSTHWLGPKEIIRTTNGPSYYFYSFVVEQFTPLQFPGFVNGIKLENMTTKERFRAHIAAVYCGKKQFWYYVSKAYPDYFEQLKQRHATDTQKDVPDK